MAILDEEALLATCAYIDLNPVAAGIADVPEASPHTSITERAEHVEAQGRGVSTTLKKAAEHGSVAVRQAHDAAVRQAHDAAVRQAHDVAGSTRPKGWKSHTGSARLKIGGDWIHRVKG